MELKFVESLGRDLRDAVLRLLRDYSEALFLAVLMALILRFFVFSAYRISNLTMEPQLKLGDFIVGYKLPYGFQVPFSDARFGRGRPKRGDVLIFKCPHNPALSCIKRVVALAGDRIEIRGKRLIINGRVAKYQKSTTKLSEELGAKKMVALKEKWADYESKILISDAPDGPVLGPLIVPPDTFFALGDNRDYSEDSRHWGPVPVASIEARAVFIWLSIEWSKDQDGDYASRIRWDRIFSRVH